ncbi:hypothetical protein KEM48_005493 [Puccinia striiformis f. sp. tritici PST-130]|nr:hypothetical protein KEM48_005493 [Puccinia striiformis f. sp. tritici PST-130]
MRSWVKSTINPMHRSGLRKHSSSWNGHSHNYDNQGRNQTVSKPTCLDRTRDIFLWFLANMSAYLHVWIISANPRLAGSHTNSFTLSGAQQAPGLSDSGSLQKFWDSGHQFKTSDKLIVYGRNDRNSRHITISISYTACQDTKASNLTKLISPSSSTGKQTPQKQANLIPSNASFAPILGHLLSVVLATLFTAFWVVLCLLVHNTAKFGLPILSNDQPI